MAFYILNDTELYLRQKHTITLLRLVFAITFLLSFADGICQQQQTYLFSYLGIRRGLAADEVRAVQQDAKGYIWIGTENGLQRFDGRRFITFYHNSSNKFSIPADEVNNLQIDSENKLWMICAGNKVGYFNVQDHKFHRSAIRYAGDIPENANTSLFLDKKGALMLLIKGSAVLTYKKPSNEFSENEIFHLPDGWKPFSISADQENNYWIGCDSGLVKYNTINKAISYRSHNTEKDIIIDQFAAQQHIIAANADRSGRFWLSANNQQPALFSYDKLARKFTDHSQQIRNAVKINYSINCIMEQRSGDIWITGNKLFARYAPASNSFEFIKSNLPGEFSIRYDVIHSLFEDREKSLWTCSNIGLYRFNPSEQSFTAFINNRYNSDSKGELNVTGISQLKKGNIVVSTEGDGLFVYDQNLKPLNVAYATVSKNPAENFTYCITERSNGDIWKGIRDGYISIYHAATNQSEKILPAILGGSTVMQVKEDMQANVWLAGSKGQLIKWNTSSNEFVSVQKFNGAINKLYIDSSGYLWVCTATSGVVKMNTMNGKIVATYTNTEKPGKKILGDGALDILQYNDSLMLIASDGFNVLNTHTNEFTYFSKDNGLLFSTVNNIIKDKLGYVWVTSRPFVCSINLEKKVVTTYDERDGVYTNSFNTATGCLLNDGRIAIGTTHDILIFDPSKPNINSSKMPPDVTISGFAVMNKWQPMDSINKLPYVELNSGQNSITIELSTLTYQTIYGFFYMMEGLDKEWKITPQQNQITFNYLPPGDYTFKAMCKNGDGTMSKNIIELKIKVKPVFWKTWWFYGFLICILVGLIYWIDKERMKRKESIQKMRSDIAGNLHQEVNIALNNINILSEMARIKTDTDPAKSKEYIEQIHSKSHQMIIAMDDMLWSISPDNDSMQKTVERMKEYIDSLINRHGVNINIVVDKKVESLELNMKLRHESFLLFKEGIRSLVQAGTKNCSISMRLEKNHLQFNMQFENAHCDMQQLNNLLHRQDLEKDMKSIHATFNVQVHKTNSVFSLMIPIE